MRSAPTSRTPPRSASACRQVASVPRPSANWSRITRPRAPKPLSMDRLRAAAARPRRGGCSPSRCPRGPRCSSGSKVIARGIEVVGLPPSSTGCRLGEALWRGVGLKSASKRATAKSRQKPRRCRRDDGFPVAIGDRAHRADRSQATRAARCGRRTEVVPTGDVHRHVGAGDATRGRVGHHGVEALRREASRGTPTRPPQPPRSARRVARRAARDMRPEADHRGSGGGSDGAKGPLSPR